MSKNKTKINWKALDKHWADQYETDYGYFIKGENNPYINFVNAYSAQAGSASAF